MRRTLSCIGVVAVGLLALHQIGSSELAGPPDISSTSILEWVNERGTVLAAFSVLRLATLVAGWYVLVVLALQALARTVRAATLFRIVDCVTLPPVRRVLAGAAGLSISSTLVLGGAVAAGADTPPTSSDRMVELPPSPEPTIVHSMAKASPTPPPPTTAPAPAAAPDEWEVEVGDSFWSIASNVLSGARDRAVSDNEIVPYWLDLIEMNLDRLVVRSAPGLIYPGQVLVLPPVSAA